MAQQYDPNDVNAVLSRIETKLENKGIVDAERWQRMERWMATHQQDCAEKGKRIEKLGGRIEKLENWRWYVLGIAVGVGVALKFLWK